MRALVIADIHSNLAAFRAVLKDAKQEGWGDAIWCLGDIVGYGPQPSECLTLLREHAHEVVTGNHDLAAIGALDLQEFNSLAAAAAAWTEAQLSQEEKTWLAELPGVTETLDFTLTHGSLVDPVWDYLVAPEVAAEHLSRQQTLYGFVGHSHQPLAFFEAAGSVKGRPLQDSASIELSGERFVANPGGLGQPRDGDPRAAYALVDTDRGSLEFHRVGYDVADTQDRMREAGLPVYLIERLARGR